jgi:hypothetical protein
VEELVEGERKFAELWENAYKHKHTNWMDYFYYKDQHDRYYTLTANSKKNLILTRGRWKKINGSGTNRITAEYVEDSKFLTKKDCLTFELAFTKVTYDEWSDLFARDSNRF